MSDMLGLPDFNRLDYKYTHICLVGKVGEYYTIALVHRSTVKNLVCRLFSEHMDFWKWLGGERKALAIGQTKNEVLALLVLDQIQERFGDSIWLNNLPGCLAEWWLAQRVYRET